MQSLPPLDPGEPGYLPIMPVNARDRAGTSRDKQGPAGTRQEQTGTRQGQAGTSRNRQGQPISVHACPCLSRSVPACPFLSLSVLVGPWQSLSVLVSPCLSLYVYTFAIPEFLPLQMIFTVCISVNIVTVTSQMHPHVYLLQFSLILIFLP